MLSEAIYSLGDPGTFDIVDKDDPQYYIARFSHEMSENFYNLQQAGFKFNQFENTDYAAIENAYDTYRGLVVTWIATAIGESNDGDPITAVPTLPDLTTLVPWLGTNPWLAFLVNTIIDLALEWLRGGLASGTEANEIAQILKQALIGKIDSTEYPLLELLGSLPIEIILTRAGEFQEILLGRRET